MTGQLRADGDEETLHRTMSPLPFTPASAGVHWDQVEDLETCHQPCVRFNPVEFRE
jgi:hypothetical protein